MATMATIFNRPVPARSAETVEARRAAVARDSVYGLRPLPNEDVYLFVKRIDNSRVVREADPAASGLCWRTIAVACTAFLLLVGVLLPGAWGLIAGYQVHSLKAEQQRLQSEFATVEADEAALLTPQRMEEWAKLQQFIEPAPERVHYLPPKADGTVALNRAGQGKE